MVPELEDQYGLTPRQRAMISTPEQLEQQAKEWNGMLKDEKPYVPPCKCFYSAEVHDTRILHECTLPDDLHLVHQCSCGMKWEHQHYATRIVW